jgi:hypothetical protein
MSFVLFLHVLAAFALVTGVVGFGVVLGQASRPGGAAALRLTPLARRLWDIGGGGTLVLGIVLALDEFEITDGWILGALVLWVVAAGAGVRLGQDLAEGEVRGRAWGLVAVAALATLGILYLMVFKPGA